MKWKLDWNRIKRTAIQSAAGAGISAVTAIAGDFSTAALIQAGVQFAVTVAVAILMNIQKQADVREEVATGRFDWNRIKRTAIQSAAGAGIAAINVIAGDFSTDALIRAGVQFAATVIIAVLMNIKKQTEDDEKEGS